MKLFPSLLCGIVAGSVALMAQLPPQSVSQLKISQLKVLPKIRTAEMLKNLTREVTLEGYFYDGSIPMLVDDIEKVRMDMPLSPDSYVPLVGQQAHLKWGDHVRVTGLLEKGVANLSREAAVLRVQNPSKLQVIAKTPLRWGEKFTLRLDPKILNAVIAAMNAPHAVLIAGGWSPADSHIRYWNDLKTMYSILVAQGYAKANITVLYADGVARDASMPVNYSATAANLNTVFTSLAGKTGAGSTVYIMSNDHGTQLAGGHTGLCLWNYQVMSDTDFAAQVDKVKTFKKMIIQMKQCFSGGFVAPLTKANRIVMSSCGPTQVSWSNSTATFGEFTFWYFSAFLGHKPDGSGAVNADANGDGKISIMEAYNFARSHDTANEIPRYDDNGMAPAQTVPLPSGGDGPFGAAAFLK